MRFGSRKGRCSGGTNTQDASTKAMRGFGPGGPPTNCICPQCGFVVPHEPGMPCFQRKCPQCGSSMARQFLKAE